MAQPIESLLENIKRKEEYMYVGKTLTKISKLKKDKKSAKN